MEIIKRNGKVESFDRGKVLTSINNCSNGLEFQMNESDLKTLSNEIYKKLVSVRGENGYTSSYEVRGITYLVLRQYGFEKISTIYMDVE